MSIKVTQVLVDEKEAKANLLCYEAERWVGLKERGGDNSGQMVEMFQKAVDGKAHGEPWCMAFVQFCVKMTDGIFEEVFAPEYEIEPTPTKLKASESVMNTWDAAPDEIKSDVPEIGSLICWQYYKGGNPTRSGHVGVVINVLDGNVVETIEGNTSDSSGVDREGDGVFKKQRRWDVSKLNSSMVCKGFLKPWG